MSRWPQRQICWPACLTRTQPPGAPVQSAITLERVVVGWLAEAVGCKGFTGSLTGGGSPANLMALAMARESRLPANEHGARPGTVYASEQAHMSIPKAVALLGLGHDNLRLIPCDDEFRMRTDELRKAIASDVAAGLTPIAIVGSAGTVTTGSIDPLQELAANRAYLSEHGFTSMAPTAHWRRSPQPEKFCRAERRRLALTRSAQVAVSTGRLRLPALSRSCRSACGLLRTPATTLSLCWKIPSRASPFLKNRWSCRDASGR